MPQHRLTPLKAHWMSLYEPVTKNLKLDMRMNLKSKKVGCLCKASRCFKPSPIFRKTIGKVSDCVCNSLLVFLWRCSCKRCAALWDATDGGANYQQDCAILGMDTRYAQTLNPLICRSKSRRLPKHQTKPTCRKQPTLYKPSF